MMAMMSAAHRRAALLGCAAALALTATGAAAADKAAHTNLYWGDVHLHSNYSLDAYATGNNATTPDLAYRFARGIPIKRTGLDAKVQIRRPLDFLAVTDHAEMLGLQVMLDQRDPRLVSTPWGQKMLEAHEKDPVRGAMAASGGATAADSPEQKEKLSQIFSPQVRQATWQAEIDAAEKNNIPGKFTTLFGWEWSSMPGGKNLHRIVLTDATPDQAKQFYPYSNIESARPEDLWKFLETTKSRVGADFIAIPHNSNISGGLMFDMVDSDGRPLSAQYAKTRQLWEPLMEVTQTKGTSEVRPELDPSDEFGEFEIRRKLLAGAPTPPSEADYARSALQRGLQVQTKVGANPYKFGMIGSTDSHTGMSSVEEGAFMGKLGVDQPLSQHYKPDRPVIFPDWEMSASGRAAVWAPENTRKAIFAAFKRKEVYATTGTRITLRVFGGYGFQAVDAKAKDIAAVGYRKGVPMGADLTAAPQGKAPQFLIWAAKDPLSGNLDRVQVVKGWVDAAGHSNQKIYDVAWSGARKRGSDGKVPAVGNTVDIATATYTNTIGATQLATVWTDRDFKPDQTAFYYVRVLEIPTPRHSLYDAVALGIDVKETHEAATIQERAYSSPIWYSPSKR
ncbi:MAG: DUF3604 domain-containing protein [Caulobacteraceae bacterium]